MLVTALAVIAFPYIRYAVPDTYGRVAPIAGLLLASCLPILVYLVCMNLLTMSIGNFTDAWKVTIFGGLANLAVVAIGAVAGGAVLAAAASALGEVVNALLAAVIYRRKRPAGWPTERQILSAPLVATMTVAAASLAASGFANSLTTQLGIVLTGSFPTAVLLVALIRDRTRERNQATAGTLKA
jgi:hypothetical protein